jgi:lipoprotein-anchoring transpeptidase ErfK/SrfK
LSKPGVKLPSALTLVALPFLASAQKLSTLDAVTFDEPANVLFVPLREVGRAFDWPVTRQNGRVFLNKRPIPPNALKQTVTGVRLVSVRELQSLGTLVNPAGANLWTVKKKAKRGQAFRVRRGQKRVFINKKAQMMVGYQGRQTVFRSRVSTGRAGKETPTGIFRAQAYKNKLHRSRIYDGAEMPWSVQIVGNVFVHGFPTVPGRAASSGCIRLPVTGANPARWFYYWVEPGTPVTILGKWPKNAG